MTRDRLALVLLATAVSAAACAAPSIDTIEEEIVVPERVSGGASDEADSKPPAGSGTSTGSTKSADTTSAPTSTGGASPPPPPPPAGKWMQANGQDCVAFCTQAGKTNVASNDGAKCTSGENIPASALAAGITYDKCFPSCAAHVSNNGSPVSAGKYCYSNGQKHDDDSSDVTRGCFCK